MLLTLNFTLANLSESYASIHPYHFAPLLNFLFSVSILLLVVTFFIANVQVEFVGFIDIRRVEPPTTFATAEQQVFEQIPLLRLNVRRHSAPDLRFINLTSPVS